MTVSAAALDQSSVLAERQKRVALNLISFAIIAVGMGQTVVFAILAPLGREVGLVELQIGTIITCSSIIYSLFSPVWGRRSDRLGRKRVMLVGLLGYTFGTLLFASTFWAGFQGWLSGGWLFAALIAARMCQSIVMSATSPAATAYVSDITHISQRTSGMGRIGASHNIGTILGPAIAGAAVFGLLAPLYLAAFTTFLAALMVMRWLPQLPVQVSTASSLPRLSYFDGRIWPFILVGVSMFTCFSVVQQTLGYYFQDLLQLDAVTTAKKVGGAMMGSAVMALCAQVFIVQRMGLAPGTLMRLGLLAIFVGFVGLALLHRYPLLVACMCVVGFGMGMAMPGFTAAASLSVEPQEQGAVAGLVSACPALGFILGPVLGAALYHVNQFAPYAFASVMLVPLIGFAWLSSRLRLDVQRSK